MIAQLQYYGLRTLWSSMGIGILAVAAIPDSFWQKIFVVLCGIITLMMSILLGSYVRHLTSHSKDREKLFEVLEEKYTRKDLFDERTENMKQSLDRIETALGTKKNENN